MSYESNPAGLGVGKTYGPRSLGGYEGITKEGAENVAVINYDVASGQVVYVPPGSVVLEIDESNATGAVSAATVGAVDVSSATPVAPVATPLGGDLTVTGPTAGSVVVRYRHVAG